MDETLRARADRRGESGHFDRMDRMDRMAG
jgi:hypothetical protein